MAKDRAAISLDDRLGWQLIGTANHNDGHEADIAAYCYVPPGPDPQRFAPPDPASQNW